MKKQRVDIRERIRKCGMKVTPPRLLVFSILERAKAPLSAQYIVEQVGNKVDQATVYRVLNDFKARGVIRPVDLRHNHAHYEIVDVHDHHHLVCVRCGRVEDIEECGVEELQETVVKRSRYFTEVTQHSLEFYGVCRSCKRKNLV